MNYIEALGQDIAQRGAVSTMVVEGPPAYLHSIRDWQPAFRNGWSVASRLSQGVSESAKVSVANWLLIDDSSGRPDHLVPASMRPSTSRVVDHYREEGILEEGVQIDYIVFESEVGQPRFALDPYPSIDARFQMGKLAITSPPDELMVVIIHPTTYLEEQRKMLGHLLGEMRRDERFKGLPRKQRISLIEQGFRHVWIDADNTVERVTQPRWSTDMGRFFFRQSAFV